MLHKNLANSVKDVDTAKGVVCGYASSFNVVDDGNDMVLPGAFTKTISEQGPASKQPRIKFLYQHDSTQILGVPQLLKEDGFGLYFEAKIAPTALGKDVLTLYEEGIITEHSIGYETVQADWDRAHAVRLLKQLRLFEFSSVTWGMNPETPTVAVKSLTGLDTLATKAATIDRLLHAGNLRSDALCETLERELKALQTALAPVASPAARETPYSIQSVLDSMSDLTDRLGRKAATQAEKDAQEARSKKYGIGIKDGGNVTKPSKYAKLADDDFADPVNYSYPLDTKAHADNAASRFGDPANRAVYTKAEQAIIDKRIAAAQKTFGEDDNANDSSDNTAKGATMKTRMVKGSGGEVAVSEDGTHAAYTGTHTHSHKAMGSQGDDDMHGHSHTHDGDAAHDHSHDAKAAQQPRQRKTFAEHYQDEQCEDLLEDWQDVVLCAFTSAVYDAFQIGDNPESDVNDALDGLKEAVSEWVASAIKYNLADYLDDQGDTYDGGTLRRMQNGDTSGGYGYGWMSRRAPQEMPSAPAALRKAGRAISSANRAVITDALDGMSKAMGDLKLHHKSIADLMTKTDPDAVRQDEDDTQGDDDTENGGHNINKSRLTSTTTPRRTAAVSTTQTGTTHQGNGEDSDLSAALAELDALKSRLVKAGGKAK